MTERWNVMVYKVRFNPVLFKKVITLLGQVILIFFIMVSCVGGVMVVLGLEYALEKISTSRSIIQQWKVWQE